MNEYLSIVDKSGGNMVHVLCVVKLQTIIAELPKLVFVDWIVKRNIFKWQKGNISISFKLIAFKDQLRLILLIYSNIYRRMNLLWYLEFSQD